MRRQSVGMSRKIIHNDTGAYLLITLGFVAIVAVFIWLSELPSLSFIVEMINAYAIATAWLFITFAAGCIVIWLWRRIRAD